MRLKLGWYKTIYGVGWQDEAMHHIWETYAEKLQLYIRHSFKLHEEAEDLVQDVMLKIHRNLDSYNPQYTFGTYVYSICRNRCIDFIWTKKDTEEYFESSRTDPLYCPEKSFARYEVDQKIRELLNGMKPEMRETAYFRFFEKMDYKKIASIMDVPLQTVKNRIFSVRRELKAGLEDYR